MREGVSTTQTKYPWRRSRSQLPVVKGWIEGLIINSEQALDLLELVQIGLRHFAMRGENRQIVREDRGVVPVETAFDDRCLVDDAVLGMDWRIGYRVINALNLTRDWHNCISRPRNRLRAGRAQGKVCIPLIRM